MKVILACRDPSSGQLEADIMKAGGLDVEFRQCDISSTESIQAFADSITTDFQRVDILVNNAAIAFKGSDPTPFCDQAEPTIHTNFFGTLECTTALLPLLRASPSPRIVNVASMAGHLRILPTGDRREEFSSPSLTLESLVALMRSFVADVKAGVHQQNRWPNTCYGMSKLGVVAMTKILAREEPAITVNACCPGYCATDMSSHRGSRTAEHGARTPTFLAMLPDGGPSGKFFSDDIEIEW